MAIRYEPGVQERTFRAPADKVWRALTRDFRPEVKVTEVLPGRKLSYEPPGNARLTWELFEQMGVTWVRLTHNGPEASRYMRELSAQLGG